MLKKCSKCRKSLSLKYFYKDKSSKDGYQNYCKKCLDAVVHKYRVQNRVRVLQYYKDYDRINRDKKILFYRQYYLDNIEYMKQKALDWTKKHPAKKLISNENRRARKAGALGRITIEDITKLYNEQNGKCFYCGIMNKLTQDHKIPLSRGGSNQLDNIVLACQSCNSKKHTKTTEEFLVSNLIFQKEFENDSSRE